MSSELVFWINTKSQLAPVRFSIEKSENFGIFLKIICSYCECSTIVADAPNFSNWKSIRANWVLVLAEKSDSGKHNCCYCTRFTTVHPTLDSVGGVGGVTHCQSLYQWLKDHQRSIAQGHSTIHSLTCYLSLSLSLSLSFPISHSLTQSHETGCLFQPVDHVSWTTLETCSARHTFAQLGITFTRSSLQNSARSIPVKYATCKSDLIGLGVYQTMPIDVSLTKRETLSHLQNEHFAIDPVFEVRISGEVQWHRFRAKKLKNAFCKGFAGDFPGTPVSSKEIEKMHFVRILLGISQEHRFRVTKLKNAFCKDFPLFYSIL